MDGRYVSLDLESEDRGGLACRSANDHRLANGPKRVDELCEQPRLADARSAGDNAPTQGAQRGPCLALAGR